MRVGPHMAPIGTTLQRGEGLSGWIWETGQPLIVYDYRNWEGQAAVYADYPWTAVVGAPLRWGDEFFGVVNVIADAPGAFSQADSELLNLFAAQAAIAITNHVHPPHRGVANQRIELRAALPLPFVLTLPFVLLPTSTRHSR